MLSEEEKKAIKNIKKEFEKNHILPDIANEDLGTLLNLIEKQSKEIEELKDFNTKLQVTKDRLDSYDKENTLEIEKLKKEIEELKEKDTANLAYYDQIYQNGIYTGQKVVEDKIKAKIEPRLKELDKQMKKEWKEYGNSREYQDMEDEWNFLQSLLEKE